MLTLFLAAAAAEAAAPSPEPDAEIVVTASRSPQEQADTPASSAVVEHERIDRLGVPLVGSLLRQTPSAAVSASGPAGSLTEVRIRGSEANHTLLFIDGIRANDPAAGNTPRFELLNADLASRVEIVRGPQSALWGSEALGGVVAVDGLAGDLPGYSASVEAGSFGFGRATASAAVRAGDASLAGALGWQRATGIDSFSGQGDKDGYRNLSGRLRGAWSVAPGVEIGAAALSLNGRTEYDGIDLLTFVHSDTLDVTRNRLAAGRLWGRFGQADEGLQLIVATSVLASSNRNLLDGEELNRTNGERWTASGQFEYRFATGALAHTAIVALEHDREKFRARDLLYGGLTDQDRKRTHDAITAEWRAEAPLGVLDFAVRNDRFSAFEDSTTLRVSALARLWPGWSLAASYGEGIAQPTFFDLYGFFPGSYVGNPALRPERSRGIEGSLRYSGRALRASLTAYRQRLRDEIVEDSTFTSTVNSPGTSYRSGVEAELAWSWSERLRLTANYAYLKATQPGFQGQSRELRRPAHSGSLVLDGRLQRWSYGASLSYVGAHLDRQEVTPYAVVRLASYLLAGARLSYRLTPAVELFARASNLLDDEYRDAVDYRTEGRGLFAGVRLTSF